MKTRGSVFLSYARDDRDLGEVADKLASHIADAGYGVWSDEQILPGDNWAEKIGEALRKSSHMIVLMSPASAKSEWVQREIEFAVGSPKYAGRLIPVAIRPTTGMPWILEKLHQVSGGGTTDEVSKRVIKVLEETTAASS